MKEDYKKSQLKKIDELKEQIQELENQLKKESNNSEKSEVKYENELNDDDNAEGIVKMLHVWKSPARVYVKRDRAWFVKVSFIAILFILFAAFLDDRLMIMGIASVLLVAFLLATVPPNLVTHKIASDGIRSMDAFVKWKRMKYFWVGEKYGQKVIYIETKIRFPNRIVMLVNKDKEKEIVRTLSRYLHYKEIADRKQGWLEKFTDGKYIAPEDYGLIINETSAEENN